MRWSGSDLLPWHEVARGQPAGSQVVLAGGHPAVSDISPLWSDVENSDAGRPSRGRQSQKDAERQRNIGRENCKLLKVSFI